MAACSVKCDKVPNAASHLQGQDSAEQDIKSLHKAILPEESTQETASQLIDQEYQKVNKIYPSNPTRVAAVYIDATIITVVFMDCVIEATVRLLQYKYGWQINMLTVIGMFFSVPKGPPQKPSKPSAQDELYEGNYDHTQTQGQTTKEFGSHFSEKG